MTREKECPLGEHSGVCTNIENLKNGIKRLESVDAEQWKAINEIKNMQIKTLVGVIFTLIGVLSQIIMGFVGGIMK